MSLGAITVHYQNPSLTRRLVESLQDCSIVRKVIVVSHDSFFLPSKGKLQFVQQTNRGYAAGLNRAVEIAVLSGIETILAANPDVVLDCNAVEALFNEHQKSAAACTFPVLLEKGKRIYGYRFSRLGSLKVARDAEWCSGACFLCDVDVWKQTGGFDETFFHYFEDRDFCLRLRRAGHKLHQAETVVVVHESKSSGNYVDGMLPKFAVKNHLLSLQRSGMLNPFSFMNVVLRHFLYLFRWKGWPRGISPWIRGIREFLTGNRV